MAFDFQSPGALATNALRKAIIEQDERRRQALLDSITQAREARLMESTDANIANTKANTESLIQQRKVNQATAEEAARLAAVKRAAATHNVGDVLAPGDTVPDELVDVAGDTQLASTHAAGSLAGPEVSPSQGASPLPGRAQSVMSASQNKATTAGTRTFKGTAEQRKAEDTKEAVRNIIASNPELQQHPGIKTALQLAEATGDYSGIYGAIARMTDPGEAAKLGSFEDYVTRTYGKNPTPQQIVQARKDFQQADDRPFAPRFIVTPGQAPVIFNPNNQGVSLANGPNGQPLAPTPTAEQVNAGTAVQKANPVLAAISELSEKINVNQGIYAKAVGFTEKQAAKINLDDDVAEYEALVQSFTPLWARALGHTGVLTEQDVQSARKALPAPGDSKTLRDRKLARIESIMSGMPRVDPNRGLTPPAKSGNETPEQRRKRLYDELTKPKKP